MKNEQEVVKKLKNSKITVVHPVNYQLNATGEKKLISRPIIVGSGPAGLFCAYELALNGYQPILIERGECVDKRLISVQQFWDRNTMNPNSNVQFGEGGAGTFSDGKLNTLVKDKWGRNREVLRIFRQFGADRKSVV